MISEEDRAWIKVLVHEAVTEAMSAERKLVEAAIQAHEDGADHDALRAFVADVDRKRDQWDKIKTSVVGAVIIGILYWVGSHTIDIAAWIVKLGGK